MKYITKKIPLTKEQRKMYIKEKYVEYPIKDKEGKDIIAEAYSSRILKRSNDEMNKNINSIKLMYGNGLCLTLIGPDDVFKDEKFEYCISKEEVPFYHVDVFLANAGFTVTDLWTDNLLEAIDYYDKLEKFFQLNPIPATDLG
jgi:hypothetical protein